MSDQGMNESRMIHGDKITKVTTHLSQNEALLFERSSPGKKAYQLPELDVPAVDAAEALGAENVRASTSSPTPDGAFGSPAGSPSSDRRSAA